MQFQEDICLTRAAALAFTTLLSIVPLITVSFIIIKSFPIFSNLGQRVQDFVFTNFVASFATQIQTHFESFVLQVNQLSISGFTFLILTAILMLFNMEQAFNVIWRVKHRRNALSAFLLYWAVLSLLPICLGIGMAFLLYLRSFPLYKFLENFAIIKALFGLGPFVLTCLIFTFFYIAVPNCKVRWIPALLGGFIAGLLFELAKFIFTLYITHFPTYALLYGALAIVPLFLIWVYISWVIILFGAVISYLLGKMMQGDPSNLYQKGFENE